MAKLVNGANSYSYTNPSIKINNSNSNLSLSSDGKYYVSSSMGVKTAGTVGNYTVSLSNAPEGDVYKRQHLLDGKLLVVIVVLMAMYLRWELKMLLLKQYGKQMIN